MRRGSLALTVSLCIGVFSAGSSQPPTRTIPTARPATRMLAARPVAHPRETAMLMATLMRYADGRPDGSRLDQQLAFRLQRLPNARRAVKRLVTRFERLTPAERQARLPGVAGLDRMQAAPLIRSQFAAPAVAAVRQKVRPIVDTLPAQTLNPSQKEEYRLDYAGLSCVTAANPATGDKPVAFTTMITHPGGPQVPYKYDSRSFPSQGSLSGITSGMTSAANAGPAWTAGVFYHSGWDPGHIFVSVLLMDDGALEAQKEDMAILYATAETVASTVDGDDRITPLFTGLQYALGVLHLSNPDRWATHSVVARIYSASDHNAYYVQAPKNTAGILWKMEAKHNTGGADYAFLYNVPSVIPQQVPVKVSLTKIVAEGAIKDKENGLADFASEIRIGNTGAEHEFARDHNQLLPGYAVRRDMFVGQKVPITIKLYERDAAPEWASTAGWIGCSVCGVWDKIPSYLQSCVYSGPCNPVFHECDLNPKPKVTTGSGWTAVTQENTTLTISFDLNTGTISGDLSGAKGQVLTSHGDQAHERRAMIQFKVE